MSSGSARSAFSSLLLVASLVALAACDAPIQLGERCDRSSQCESPLACVLGRCRAECVDNRDCSFEGECHVVDGVGVCRLPSDVCTADAECTAPLVCAVGGVCRASCIGDEDCAEGSRCAPSGGRNLCLPDADVEDAGPHDAATPDGGLDDASRPDAGRSCYGATNRTFSMGLQGYCVEGSSGLDVTSSVQVVGPSGDARAISIDLAGAAADSWIRIYQDMALDEGLTTTAFFTAVDTTGGAVVVALEALDATGALVARFATAQGSDGEAACDAAERPSDGCLTTGPSLDVALLHGPILGNAATPVDLTRVVTLRRSVEVIARGTAGVRATLDALSSEPSTCPLAWWRGDDVDVLRESFDRPWSELEGSLAWAGPTSAPVRTYRTSICGAAVELESERWIERATPLPLASGALTIELWWHGEIGVVPRADRTHAMLWQGDGDLALVISGGALRASVGRCAGGGAALAVSDDLRPIGVGDQRMQEVELLVDWPARRLCLYREGVEIGCDEDVAAGCTAMPLEGGPLRIGAGAPTHERFRGAMDELRVRTGVHTPGSFAASGACYLDRVCAPGAPRAWVRDAGSRACVDPGVGCTTVSPCPQHARVGTACAADPRDVCMLSTTCFQGVALCGEASSCRRAEQCRDQIRITPAACP